MSSLLFFLKKLSRYQRELFFGILLSILLTFSSVALLALSGWFISAAAFAGLSVTAATAFNYFLPASLVRFLAFIRILSRYADRVINHNFTFRILSELRVWFYQVLIPLTPAYLLKQRSGDLLNHIVHDIDTLDHLYLNILSPVFIALFLLIAITFFTAHFSGLLAIMFFIITFSAVILLSLIIFSQSQLIGHAIQQTTAQLRTHTVDFLQGFSEILLFVKKEKRLNLLKTTHQKLMDAQYQFAVLKGFAISSMQLSSGVTTWVLLWCGIPLVNNNIISGAQLAMIILLVIASFEQFLSLPFAFLSLGKTKAAADRLLTIANTEPAVFFPAEKYIPQNHDLLIDNVSFSVLKNITLSIPAGTKLGITGESGVGKTTLANLIARIWDPESGDIKIGNINIKLLSEAQLRKTVALVTQHVHIFNASIRDNLTVPGLPSCLSSEKGTKASLARLLEKMELLNTIQALPSGLDTMMGEFGKNFSGGQIRRISIARALLADTPILILDEPSTGLEKTQMERIWKNCENDFQNKTVITITHDEKLLSLMDAKLSLSLA